MQNNAFKVKCIKQSIIAEMLQIDKMLKVQVDMWKTEQKQTVEDLII